MLIPLVARARTDVQYKISTEKFKDDDLDKHLLDLAVMCDQEINRVCKDGALAVPIVFSPGRDAVYNDRGIISIGLNPAQPDYVLAPRVMRAMLWRRLLEFRPTATVGLDDLPEWLVAALVWRMRDRYRGILTNTFFPAANALASNGFVPDLDRLVTVPVPPSETIFYFLYGEPCAILLRGLDRANHDVVAAYLQAIDPRTSASEQFRSILPPAAVAIGAQPWFAELYNKAGIWAMMPGSYDYSLARLKDLQTVSVMSAGTGANGNVRSITLSELTQKDLDGLRRNGVVQTMVGNLSLLYLSSPVLLHDPYNAGIEALRILERGKASTFTTRWKAAMEQTDAAAERGRQVSTLLDQYEVGVYGPVTRISPFKTLLDDRLPVTPWERDVSTWLDQLIDAGGRAGSVVAQPPSPAARPANPPDRPDLTAPGVYTEALPTTEANPPPPANAANDGGLTPETLPAP